MFPNRANPHCSSSSLSRPLSRDLSISDLRQQPLHRRLRLRPRSLGRRSCSATEQQAKRRQPPSRHRRKGSSHRRATVAPPSSSRCGLRRATVAPPSLLCCGLLRATAALCVRRAPSVVHSSPHFATVPHSHLALLLRVTAPASILCLVRQFCPG